MLATADDGQRTLAIQMAAYHARAVHNNCGVATPDTPRTAAASSAAGAKHVVMNTPSMQNVAATQAPAADVTDAAGYRGDADAAAAAASDEPNENRSLLTRHSTTTDADRRRYHYQLDLQTV